MRRIIKNTLLEYLEDRIESEKTVNPLRIFTCNNKPIKKGEIIYLCEREIRSKDNFSLQFGIQKSNELNLPLRIVHPKQNYEYLPKQKFIDSQIEQAKSCFKDTNLDFSIIDIPTKDYLKKIKPGILIVDFNPILDKNPLYRMDCRIYEIDGHNIIPAKFVSDKQEYNAATLRRKIYRNIYSFLTQFDNITEKKVEADYVLKDFIENKLPYYAKLKNDPTKNVLSGLSKYLNLGFISSQRVVLSVLESTTTNDNKEAFLEELIIRKELGDNFCLYAKNPKNFSNIPTWAKNSLEAHKNDLRSYIYSIDELENSKTHDKLWNATQNQLRKEGIIHGYLRMYWAKKIPEWTSSIESALEYAIYLNDKYAFDAPSTNGYTNILWSIAGLHDRAFMDYPVSGKIRRMTYNSLRKKFDIELYIKKYI